jgi:hypothetical protein
MIVAIIKYMILKKRTTQIWKNSKTILIYKGGDENNPVNMRPITRTSVIHRIIFGRISQVIMDMEDCPMKRIIL